MTNTLVAAVPPGFRRVPPSLLAVFAISWCFGSAATTPAITVAHSPIWERSNLADLQLSLNNNGGSVRSSRVPSHQQQPLQTPLTPVPAVPPLAPLRPGDPKSPNAAAVVASAFGQSGLQGQQTRPANNAFEISPPTLSSLPAPTVCPCPAVTDPYSSHSLRLPRLFLCSLPNPLAPAPVPALAPAPAPAAAAAPASDPSARFVPSATASAAAATA
ncbi:unnamed protein product [Closterium sp. Naga37s-1]|nr:unnamed protein product [Closterium sp. Naga37s-1]